MTAGSKNEADGSDGPRNSRIIFGSCNSQHYEQPFWKVIRERNPTAFIWAGDAVYADDQIRQSRSNDDHTEEQNRWRWPTIFKGVPQFTPATPEYLRQLYTEQLEVQGYRQLLQEDNGVGGKISIFGAIDDHDYGINNGDRTFRFRRESGIEFTKFLGLKSESSAMSRRAAKGLGVYGVQVYNFSSTANRLLTDTEAGLDPDVVPELKDSSDRSNDSDDETTNQLVAVFVLDVRSNKTPWAKKIPDRFTLDPEGDFLGERQWKWFETAIGRSKASVNIVVSGIQVHAPWFYDSNKIENWSGFPKAQHRLYQAILQPNVRAPILMSGDVHMSQFLRKDCRRMTAATTTTTADSTTASSHRLIRPLYEVTSSGMTHSLGSKASSFCGRPNKSRLCYFNPARVLVKAVMTYAHYVSPWTALLQSNGNGSSIPIHTSRRWQTQQQQYSLDRNVAEFDFDWTKRIVTVRILGDEGQTLVREDWPMHQLTTTEADTMLSDEAFEIGQHRLESSLKKNFPADHSEFICVNYRGNINRVQFALSVVSTIGVFSILGMCPIFLCVFLFAKVRSRRHQTNGKHLYTRKKIISNSVCRPKKD